MTTMRESRCSLLLAETKLAKIRFHTNIKAGSRVTIGTLMSRDLCYHGYETVSRCISGFVIDSLEGGHTHTQTRIQKFADRSNSKKPGARKKKIILCKSYKSCSWLKLS